MTTRDTGLNSPGRGMPFAAIDPTIEEAYWRAHFRNRPYVAADEPFDSYLPAYRLGWQSRADSQSDPSLSFADVDERLARAWDALRERGTLTWERAKHAVRDAWDRFAVERAENEGMPPLHAPPERPNARSTIERF